VSWKLLLSLFFFFRVNLFVYRLALPFCLMCLVWESVRFVGGSNPSQAYICIDGLFFVPRSGRFGFGIRESAELLYPPTKSCFLFAIFVIFYLWLKVTLEFWVVEVFALCQDALNFIFFYIAKRMVSEFSCFFAQNLIGCSVCRASGSFCRIRFARTVRNFLVDLDG
jgi:hypothetical protein